MPIGESDRRSRHRDRLARPYDSLGGYTLFGAAGEAAGAMEPTSSLVTEMPSDFFRNIDIVIDHRPKVSGQSTPRRTGVRFRLQSTKKREVIGHPSCRANYETAYGFETTRVINTTAAARVLTVSAHAGLLDRPAHCCTVQPTSGGNHAKGAIMSALVPERACQSGVCPENRHLDASSSSFPGRSI